MIGLQHYLIVSTVLFGIGLWGMLTRRNILMVLLSIELILNAANLSMVAFSAHNNDISGQAVVFFTMIVAAAEVTVGLSIVVLLYRRKETVDIDKVRELKW